MEKGKPEFEFDCYWGKDGTPVVHIDTGDLDENQDGPVCRVYLNDDTDDPLWANPKFPRKAARREA